MRSSFCHTNVTARYSRREFDAQKLGPCRMCRNSFPSESRCDFSLLKERGRSNRAYSSPARSQIRWSRKPCLSIQNMLRSREFSSGTRTRAIGEDSGGKEDEENEEKKVDIDSLASQLSQAAEKLRRTESGKEATTSTPAQNLREPDDPIFGPQAMERQRQFMQGIEGGFTSNDFEITQQIGQIGWVTQVSVDDPLQSRATTAEQVKAIVAFSARYFSGGPFQDPVRVLLKEYLPGALPVGSNELEVSTTLSGLPEMKWQIAVSELSSFPPVVPILGYFYASQSETGVTMSITENQQSSSSQEALWLVYKWENLQPLSFYASFQQGSAKNFPFQLIRRDLEAEALHDRCFMLRALTRGILSAVAFCHDNGIAHNSIGSGSFLANTFNDYQANSLIVKITNLGFAQKFEDPRAPFSEGVNPPDWQKADLLATSIVILEIIFSALAEGGGSERTEADSLQRMVVEVFKGDMDQFRYYLTHEADFLQPSILLDQFGSSGWALISSLASGQRTASDLLRTCAFVDLNT